MRGCNLEIIYSNGNENEIDDAFSQQHETRGTSHTLFLSILSKWIDTAMQKWAQDPEKG